MNPPPCTYTMAAPDAAPLGGWYTRTRTGSAARGTGNQLLGDAQGVAARHGRPVGRVRPRPGPSFGGATGFELGKLGDHRGELWIHVAEPNRCGAGSQLSFDSLPRSDPVPWSSVTTTEASDGGRLRAVTGRRAASG